MGVSFQFRHPRDARACNRPQSEQGSVDRHKKCPSLWRHCSWGCFIICRIMVSFDVAQDREPVERPFHHLWTDGDATKKRPPCTLTGLWRRRHYVSYFWDTTLVPHFLLDSRIQDTSHKLKLPEIQSESAAAHL